MLIFFAFPQYSHAELATSWANFGLLVYLGFAAFISLIVGAFSAALSSEIDTSSAFGKGFLWSMVVLIGLPIILAITA